DAHCPEKLFSHLIDGATGDFIILCYVFRFHFPPRFPSDSPVLTLTNHDSIAGNIRKAAGSDPTILRCDTQPHTRSSQMLKMTRFKSNVFCPGKVYSRRNHGPSSFRCPVIEMAGLNSGI